jgi:glucokinase
MSSVNIPLQHVPLRDILGRRLDIPVHVDNDASVAALAEAHSEQGELLAQSVVMFTVGTGIGGGIVLGGRIYPRRDELGGRVRALDPVRRPDGRRAAARGLPAAGVDRARGVGGCA